MVTRFIVERERGECDVENWFLSTQSGLMDSLRVFYETSLYITCTSSVTNNNVSDSVTSNCSLFDEDIIAVSMSGILTGIYHKTQEYHGLFTGCHPAKPEGIHECTTFD